MTCGRYMARPSTARSTKVLKSPLFFDSHRQYFCVIQIMSRVTRSAMHMGSRHVDVNAQKELGWGSASFTKGTCTYGTRINLKSCAVYISHKCLTVLFTEDENSHNGARRMDDFSVKISDIDDIQILRGEDIVMPIYLDEEKEKHRMRTILKLRSTKDKLLIIDTYESSTFTKHLLSAWHSYICLRSSGLQELRTNASATLAREYLTEAVKSFPRNKENAQVRSLRVELERVIVLHHDYV